MVVHDGKTADGDCEDLGKFLQSILRPFFAVERFLTGVERGFAKQARAAGRLGAAESRKVTGDR